MEFHQFIQDAWGARWSIAQGTGVTLIISMLAISLGTLLGIAVGMILTYGHWTLRLLIRIYTDFLRGTPVFVLILACFYILAVVGIQLTAFEAGVFALTLFCSSHVGEIVRGALQAIPNGQTEAAKALGLRKGLVLRLVVLPQALRVIIPPLTSQYLNLTKNSSLAILIGYYDLLNVSTTIFNQTGRAVEMILLIMASYTLMSLLTSLVMNVYNRRMKLVER